MKNNLVKLSLVICLVLIACPAAALNQWTVMLYLVSDDSESTSLVKSHIQSLNDMAAIAGNPGKFEVVVQIDAPKGFSIFGDSPAGGAFRLDPGPNGKWRNVKDLGEVNMGSPYCLWEFLKWTAKEHPAKQYALFVAGHGSGIFSWRGDGNVNSDNPGLVRFDPDKFVGYDDTDDDCLTIFETEAVLQAFKDKLAGGRALDLLVLDSCLPGAIEALYQLREVVTLMVSSPSTTVIGGMPYPGIVSMLRKNPMIADEEFGEQIAKMYVQKVGRTWGGRDEVMGVYRPKESAALAGALNQLSVELSRAKKENPAFSIKDLTTYGGKKRYWDIGRLLKSIIDGKTSLSGISQPSQITTLAQEAYDSLKASRVTAWYSGDFADKKVSGVSVAWPEKSEYVKWRNFYRALQFSQDTRWDEFLDTWLGVK